MENPFGSEDAAFRFLLRGLAVFVVIIALIVLVKAVV